jgi:transposase-like protein
MSAKRKQSAVLRLLRGEALELVSRELGVMAAELTAWRDAFRVALCRMHAGVSIKDEAI